MSAARKAKLADKLGIQDKSGLLALQNVVDNPDEGNEQYLKSSAQKMVKIKSKFGEENAVKFALGINAVSVEPKDSYRAKLKKARPLDSTDELVSSLGSLSADSLNKVDIDEHPPKQTSNLTPTLQPTLLAPPSPFSPDTTSQLTRSRSASMERRARTGKLADFFGVRSDDKVDDIRRLTDKTRENENRSRVPMCLIRIHFGNQTHMIVASPVQGTALELLSSIMRKLLLCDDINQYGLYEFGEGKEERLLDVDEQVFQVVRQWSGKEYLMFKRKTKSRSVENFGFGKTHSDNDDGDDEEIVNNISDTCDNKTKKMAKLQTFFGVSANDSLAKQEQVELEEILGSIKGGKQMNLSKLDLNRLQDWKKGAIKIETVVKEGWLKYSDRETKELRNAWVTLENDSLILRLTQSKDYAISENDPTLRIPLQGLVAETVNTQPNKFVLQSQNSNNKNTSHKFITSSVQSTEDWLSCIRQITQQSTSNSSKLSGLLQTYFNPQGQAPIDGISIEDFEFHRVLGKGKYGKVLLCSHKTTKKVFAIKVLEKNKETEDTAKTESEILRIIQHPFIVGLHYALQNENCLYMVMEYVNGGELFFHLSQQGKFDEARTKFYAAEIMLALQCLHGKGIVYRDLKLENILLDKDGHIKVADFGLSSMEAVNHKSYTMAGTTEYFSPEILLGFGCSFPADWWAYGIVIFELACGYNPFYNPNYNIMYKLVTTSRLEFPAHLSSNATDLIVRLLERDPNKRFGCGAQGSREIQDHPFFSDIDFTKLFRKEIPTPWQPDVVDAFDLKFFDVEFTSEAIIDEDVKGSSRTRTRSNVSGKKDILKGFNYIAMSSNSN